jgi:glycerol-3-phosphate dehydrogenase (NAD(P)+)
MGLGRDESIRRMAGATLECLEILEMMRRALAGFQERGLVASKELPLLRHLIAVALDDAPVAVPFAAFG